MIKRRTTKPRRRPRPQVLEVRVMSPRIAWFGFLRLFGRFARFAVILALIAGAGWGTWQGIQKALYQNEDFRLQSIDLNQNSAINEQGVVETAQINLTANIFEINIKEVEAKLRKNSGIADVKVERHLPGKLVVRVTPRVPKAWIAAPEQDLAETRQIGATLVDENSVAYACPAFQFEKAKDLPVIQILSSNIPLGEKISRPELDRCLMLLESAVEADFKSIQWIESLKQVNQWSIELASKDGTVATFGLGDHARQMRHLYSAIHHSTEKGYEIETINLIPKHNVPITLKQGSAPPRKIEATQPRPQETRENRRARDMKKLLNQN